MSPHERVSARLEGGCWNGRGDGSDVLSGSCGEGEWEGDGVRNQAAPTTAHPYADHAWRQQRPTWNRVCNARSPCTVAGRWLERRVYTLLRLLRCDGAPSDSSDWRKLKAILVPRLLRGGLDKNTALVQRKGEGVGRLAEKGRRRSGTEMKMRLMRMAAAAQAAAFALS